MQLRNARDDCFYKEADLQMCAENVTRLMRVKSNVALKFRQVVAGKCKRSAGTYRPRLLTGSKFRGLR
ncbi:hypothetical protein TNCV_3015351 [Trichonephila clavipes]|nr:hypothetical protein TNCV_3015351 [Trichonephila clavipes]